MRGAETREKIFQAAMRLAARDGLLNLTLDKVAEESGLSKGGVMHHFATKDALLHGVISHFSEGIERTLTRLVAEDTNPTYRWVRAMMRVCGPRCPEAAPGEAGAAASDFESPETLDRFFLSLLAAAVHNPEVLKPVLAIGQRLRGRLTANPEEGMEQLLLWLAVDGLFLWRFVGLVHDDDPLIEQVFAAVSHRIETLSAKTPPPASEQP